MNSLHLPFFPLLWYKSIKNCNGSSFHDINLQDPDPNCWLSYNCTSRCLCTNILYYSHIISLKSGWIALIYVNDMEFFIRSSPTTVCPRSLANFYKLPCQIFHGQDFFGHTVLSKFLDSLIKTLLELIFIVSWHLFCLQRYVATAWPLYCVPDLYLHY